MLLVHHGGTDNHLGAVGVRELWVVVGYVGFQWALASGFLVVKRQHPDTRLFPPFLLLALAPLLAVKLAPVLLPTSRIGFVGVSYVTFRALDVLIGIRDRSIAGLSPLVYLSYLFFFPTISAGPIDRYRRFLGDWSRTPTREETLVDLDQGIHAIFTGLLYKFIIAVLIKQYWMDPIATADGILGIGGYMYGYSLYLFFDFAGYSKIAIGVARLFGVRVPENFDRPFLSRNIVDFWNRWHISLSTWFRDQIYMRFMLAATKRRWFRQRHVGSAAGYAVTFLLMGLWHGIAVRYLIYGSYHAALLGGYGVFNQWNKERKLWGDGPVGTAAAVLVTFNLVCFGFLIFSGRLV